jgi:CDP-6-deoxy-D-xylo-4-hexulose-3-dehydrase
MIRLVEDTISRADIRQLIRWLSSNPRLTKDEVTRDFERRWTRWLGARNSVFVNSGSSANFLMFYSLILSNRLRNKKIIAPAVSWVTTVSPILQLGLEPILCDCDPENLGLDVEHFKKLIRKHHPSAAILVHVLGHPNRMDEILGLCRENRITLLEDCCEAAGTVYRGKKVGTFGDLSSFSFYFGHHMSTIEGGMVCINDDNLTDYILSTRSHGWARDISPRTREKWEKEFNIDAFRSLYTFYYPGFNFRPTDLQAFLGILQLRKLESYIEKRRRNFEQYGRELSGLDLWKQHSEADLLSSFAYGLAHRRRDDIVRALQGHHIECRPLICGSIARQPFWIRHFGVADPLPNADFIHDFGLYVPNHPELTAAGVKRVCRVIRGALESGTDGKRTR